MSLIRLRTFLKSLWLGQSGVSSMEYAFLAAVVALSLISVLAAIGSSVVGLLSIPPDVMN